MTRTRKHALAAASGIIIILCALWIGAWGWSLINNEDQTAYAIALLVTQALAVVGGAMLAAFSGAKLFGEGT